MLIKNLSLMNQNSPFKKVKLTRGYKQVAHQIQQAIVDQHLKPGDKLPPQSALIETFQVSKFTLMGALRLLEQSGLVYTKHGALGGTFVSEIDTEAFTASLKLLISLKKVTLEELAEVRLTVEGRVAYWAAKRRRPKDLKRLRELLNNMEQLLALDHPMEEMIHMDMAFHLAIARSSHNELYVALMETINECFLDETFSYIPVGNERRIYTDHAKIFRAIHAKKTDAAEKAVRDHITYFKKLIIHNLRPELRKG
jgi:DNA-binding FadR family transcriptional regulator